MTDYLDLTCETFSDELASKKSVPSGGGASAYVGALGASLGHMAGIISVSKADADDARAMTVLLTKLDASRAQLLELVDADAEAFAPLARAYKLPSGTEEEKQHKARVMEEALKGAAAVPMEAMRACARCIAVLDELEDMVSKILISDIGCGAVFAKAAMQASYLNVLVNTRLMADAEHAEALEREAVALLAEHLPMAEGLYARTLKEL